MEVTQKNIDESKVGYKKTKLGWIPEDWSTPHFFEIAKRKKDKLSPKNDSSSNFKCIELEHIESETGRLLGYTDSESQKSTKNKFVTNNILFGKLRPYLRKYWYAEFAGVCSSEIWVLKNKKDVSTKYLYYFVQTNRFISATNVTTGTKMPRADWDYVSGIKFPLPPLPEQKKIAEILSAWDRAIETLDQLIAKKEELKKGLMQQLLTGKKRYPGFKGEWREVRFKDVVKIDAKSLNSKTSPDYEFEYISLSDVENGQISNDLEVYEFKDAPSRAKRIVSEGDILMATVRPNLKAFALAKKEHQSKIASTGFAVLTPKKNLNIKYLYHYLFSHHISGQFYALTVGSNYPAINSSDVKKLKIRLPEDHEEINKIESALTNIDKEIKSLEKNKEMFMIQKKGLMQHLLTGETRVKRR